MPNYLQACAARDAAQGVFDKARAASEAAPNDKAKGDSFAKAATALGVALRAVEQAASNDPALAKHLAKAIEARVVHHERYEKKTVQTDDKPPPSSEEEEASGPPASGNPDSAPPKTQPSEPASSEEEEGRAGKAAPPKMHKGAKGESEEEEEEKAIAAAYAASVSSYKKAMRGENVDALGVLYGPAALLGKVQKALGTTSIRETFGALETLPDRLQANDKIAGKVERLEKNDRASRVSAMIDKAKAAGVPITKERRAYLHAQGMAHGTAHLRGMLSQFPKMPTNHAEADEKADGRGGLAALADKEAEKLMAEMCAGLDEKEAEIVREEFKARMAKATKAPVT